MSLIFYNPDLNEVSLYLFPEGLFIKDPSLYGSRYWSIQPMLGAGWELVGEF
jgi:hypothetical protein